LMLLYILNSPSAVVIDLVDVVVNVDEYADANVVVNVV